MSKMIFKIFFVLYVIGVREVACCCFGCPLVTEEMAKTCITTDPECASVPVSEGECFNGCTRTCLTRCPLVTEDMAKTCITTDPECAAVPLMENNCFNGCTIICSKPKVDDRNSTTVKPAMK
ncbi:uncharacterized protein [Magallana gigas]|uniref:uncharacterized protein n=1 Tax=Magallana gigas TaxID=29159 RepID=UPI00333F6064